MWLMEEAPAGFLQSTEVLVAYVLFVNFASIHTTSMVRPVPYLLQSRINRPLAIHSRDVRPCRPP